MRQPPSPLLLSARKRRPRRNPPRGAQNLAADTQQPAAADAKPGAASSDGCALLQRDGFDASRQPGPADDEPSTSSR
jgi:hypothetical protein